MIFGCFIVILGCLDEYMVHKKMPHIIIELFILLWEHDRDPIDEIDGVRYLSIIEDLDRIVARNFAFYDPHSSFDICDIRLFAERNSIDILKKSTAR